MDFFQANLTRPTCSGTLGPSLAYYILFINGVHGVTLENCRKCRRQLLYNQIKQVFRDKWSITIMISGGVKEIKKKKKLIFIVYLLIILTTEHLYKFHMYL